MEMTTLEERRHQADMALVFKILTGKDQVAPTEWFTMAGEAARATKATADPLNIRIRHGRLDRYQKKLLHCQSYRTVEPNSE